MSRLACDRGKRKGMDSFLQLRSLQRFASWPMKKSLTSRQSQRPPAVAHLKRSAKMNWRESKSRWHGAKRPKVEPTHFSIQGQEYDRVRYGDGTDDLDSPKCDDCGVARGK